MKTSKRGRACCQIALCCEPFGTRGNLSLLESLHQRLVSKDMTFHLPSLLLQAGTGKVE